MKQAYLAVIGDPVAHSLSPPMQSAALKDLGLNIPYRKIHVSPEDLKKFLRQASKEMLGFNSTLPHKEKLIPLLDWVSPKARLIGAVNTVVIQEGKTLGFNTDGDGYLASLTQGRGFDIEQKNICILGAGGAARSLAVALAAGGLRTLTLANRTPAKAQALVASLKKSFPKIRLSWSGLHGTPFHRALNTADLLINTTSLGLDKTGFEDFPWQHLAEGALVSDIVYSPLVTPFLREAKNLRYPIHTGEGMLVHQGALSLLLWTGKIPNTELMHREVLKELKGGKKN